MSESATAWATWAVPTRLAEAEGAEEPCMMPVHGVKGWEAAGPEDSGKSSSISAPPRKECTQTGDEALDPANSRLLLRLTSLQEVQAIFDNTQPALSKVNFKL